MTKCVNNHIKYERDSDEFYLSFEQKSEFWSKFTNSGSIFLCQHET